jgi:hypothetical protein
MGEFEDKIALEEFVQELLQDVNTISNLGRFMLFDQHDVKVVNHGFKILRDHIEKMTKCYTIEEMDKLVKVKKITKPKEGKYR